MADHAVAVELFYDGAWQDAAAYSREGIKSQIGAGGEGQQAPPSTLSLTLGGDVNPTDPVSPLYGLAGRNTPVRVSADAATVTDLESVSWAPGRAIFGDAWTALQGAGVLSRMQQGTSPLRSPLERAMTAAGPVAFWPMTEGEQATQISSGLVDGPPIAITNVSTGAIVGPPGAPGPFPDLAPADGVFGQGFVNFPQGELASTGWGFECVFHIGPAKDPGVEASVTVLSISTADGDDIDLNIGTDPPGLPGFPSGPRLTVFARVGGANVNTGDYLEAFSDGPGYGWHHLRWVATQVGADVDVKLYVDGILVETESAAAVTLTTPTSVVIGDQWPDADEDELNATLAGLGMLGFFDSGDLVDRYDAFTGHAGELTTDRFVRVLTEEGIGAVVVGDDTDAQPMGPQPTDTLTRVIRECVRTDHGLLWDQRSVYMRTGRSLANQTSALTLNFSTEGISAPLAPVLDDKHIANDVTAVRRNGSEARYFRATGPLNVSDPVDDPDGVGRYDTRLDVNPATDDRLLLHAAWAVHLGTVPEPRWPQVTVDLDAVPALTSAVDAVGIGDVITLTGLPASWAQGDVRLLVVGIRNNFPAGAGDFRRLVTFVCVPASPYEVAIVGEAAGGVDLRGQAVDTDRSTLAGGITSSATSLSVASTGGVLWSTESFDRSTSLNGAGEFGAGLFIVIGGEVMRVSNLTGASSPQTFTVVRSVNGVVKAHSAGSPVHVYQPVYVGL